ncbi:MAG: NAD(P)(+) transhydrogenase (Re/Si-specific) subunit beta [Nitrospiraceae bacterium]|nr:NAD(P)(+) transhydrogenase (Re/Si-specific) subunit beta [Nitrospiraceae bacterium]
MTIKLLINASYFIVAILFIQGLKGMSSPVTARRGIMWAGAGMVLATLVTFGWPGMSNYTLMVIALGLGGGLSAWSGTVVKMTDMPQMVALYNGMGGGAAASIAAIELARGETHGTVATSLAVLGGLIGTVSFSGSLVAFAKLQGIMKKTFHLPAQNAVNVVLAAVAVIAGAGIVAAGPATTLQLVVFFLVALALGAIITLPIGGADMPVVISLFNALTGLAVGFEGLVLNNPALIIAGIVVGSAGTLLTQLMAKAMNRPLTNILFKPITGEAQVGGTGIAGTMKEISALDAAAMLRYAQKVIIVPGYGMAVGQAQHKVKEMSVLLEEAGITVKFAIHPVAGRMPGHMNVLLAEAGVPYDRIFDLEEINGEFSQADVALVIGANDVVNPAARTEKSSPIYGMPILNADQAHNVIVVKRGKGTGYSGIENALFYNDNTRMLYGSAQQVVNEVIKNIKELMA